MAGGGRGAINFLEGKETMGGAINFLDEVVCWMLEVLSFKWRKPPNLASEASWEWTARAVVAAQGHIWSHPPVITKPSGCSVRLLLRIIFIKLFISLSCSSNSSLTHIFEFETFPGKAFSSCA